MIVIFSLRSHHLHYYLSRKLKRYMRGIAGISIVTHIRAFRPLDVHSERRDGQLTLHILSFKDSNEGNNVHCFSLPLV